MASTFYEYIGRLVVTLLWTRFGGKLKVAGAVFAALALVAGVLLARRVPPEG